MNKITSLTKVLLKESYQDFSIFDKEKKKLNKKSIIFWLMAIVFIGMIYISYQIIIFLKKAGQPEIFLDLYFFILTMFLVFQSMLMSANIFFFSKDMEKILPLPIKPVEILVAKFNTLVSALYVTEAILGLVPLTLYGLLTNAHFLFYLWEIIILAIFPILFALVVSIFVLGMMRLAKFIRNKDAYQVVISLILIILFTILETTVINGLFGIKSDEQALQQMTSFSEKVEEIGKYFLVINPSITMLTNPTHLIKILLALVSLISCNLLAGIVFITIGKITYLKDILKNMVSKSNKKRRKIEIKKYIKKRSVRKAYILKELKTLVKEPAFFMQCILPVMIILVTGVITVITVLPTVTEVLQDDTIQLALQNVSFNIEIVCYILILLQVLFSISNISLTAISREGKNAIFMKQIPISYYKQFQYKNVPQVLLNTIVSIIVLGMIWYLIPNFNVVYLLMIFVIAMLINWINSYLMLMVDLRRPNLDWDTQFSVVKKSNNKFFQYAFMIVNILFLMYVAKWFEEITLINALFGEILVFGIIFLVIDRCVKKWQNKLFNKIN